jgi:hypothetical protein
VLRIYAPFRARLGSSRLFCVNLTSCSLGGSLLALSNSKKLKVLLDLVDSSFLSSVKSSLFASSLMSISRGTLFSLLLTCRSPLGRLASPFNRVIALTTVCSFRSF